MMVNSNQDQFSWEANACMLTKTHHAYPAVECDSTLTQLDDDGAAPSEEMKKETNANFVQVVKEEEA